MDNVKQNASHMIMSIVVIVAAVVLAALHIITGGTAVALIGPAGGFTLAAGSLSTMYGPASQTAPAPSVSLSADHATIAPASSLSLAQPPAEG